MNEKENSLDRLGELSKAFNDAFDAAKRRIDDKWNSLSKEDQLDYFCAVVKRIHQGDVEEGRSYRGVLYGVFEFGPEAYAIAQMSGYLDIHNLITTPEEERRLLSAFSQYVCRRLNILDTDPEQLVSDFRDHNPNKDEF
jgi:hypothetical protein